MNFKVPDHDKDEQHDWEDKAYDQVERHVAIFHFLKRYEDIHSHDPANDSRRGKDNRYDGQQKHDFIQPFVVVAHFDVDALGEIVEGDVDVDTRRLHPHTHLFHSTLHKSHSVATCMS